MRKVKRILGLVIGFCLCLSMMTMLSFEANALSYSGSASYMNGKYYKQLCAVSLTGNGATDIVNVAKSQIGYRSGASNSDLSGSTNSTSNVKYSEYGRVIGSNPNDWCAYFVSWCARQAGISTSVLPNFGYCPTAHNNTLPAAGCTMFRRGAGTPTAGDMIFFGTSSSNIYHVGIVTSATSSTVYYIDGNNTSTTPHCVSSSSRSLSNSSIWGYARPNYANKKPSKPTVTTARSEYVKGESVKISWTAVTGNTNYCINVYKNGTLIYEASLGTKTSYTLKSAAVGSYKVYVSANNSAGTSGTSSCTFKVSLFNTHTHDYTGSRVYESAHPHAITQRCVDYATCGGYKNTGEYYEVKSCEKCWNATISIGASSVSIKVGDSKIVSATVGGCLPDSAVAYPDFSTDNDVVKATIANQQITFTGLKAGTADFRITIYSDSSKTRVIARKTIPITVTEKTYIVTYNANGGTGAPSSQTKKHGTALTLSTVKPTRSGYTFLGWATSGTATSASYKSGGSFTKNANTTLYAVWKKDSCTHKYGYKLVKEPTRSEKGSLLGTCSYCSAKTTVTLPKLNTTDYYYGKINASCTLYGKAVYRWETKEGQSFWFTEKISEVGHQYTNACDTTCNVCKAKRSIKHKYTNSCDTTCNVCGTKRSITHKYKTTTTKATLKKNGSVVKKCTVCDKVASNVAIKYAKTIKLSTTSYTYNGKVKTPTVTVKDSAGKTLKKNTDYTVKYASGRKNVGTYKVTITFKGKYSGTKVLTFKILPKAASVNKLTAKTKALTVKLNSQKTQTSGYQIQYATTKTFKSYKTATITSNKTTTKTISGLKTKTTYYVRVRTYKTVSGVKIYSNWSAAKSMKTK